MNKHTRFVRSEMTDEFENRTYKIACTEPANVVKVLSELGYPAAQQLGDQAPGETWTWWIQVEGFENTEVDDGIDRSWFMNLYRWDGPDGTWYEIVCNDITMIGCYAQEEFDYLCDALMALDRVKREGYVRMEAEILRTGLEFNTMIDMEVDLIYAGSGPSRVKIYRGEPGDRPAAV